MHPSNSQLLLSRKDNLLITKYILLAGIVISIISILAILLWDKKSDVVNNDINDPNISMPEKQRTLSMDKSTFEGLNKYQKEYKILADKASKFTEDQYELTAIETHYPSSKYQINITAPTGIISNKHKWLLLKDDVKMTIQDMIFLGNEVKIDLHSQDAQSDNSIIILRKNSTILSDEFETKESGNIIHFKGNVRSSINQQDFLNVK